MKEEEYYFKDYYGNDAAQIEKAKAAIEDKELEGNRESMMDQTVRLLAPSPTCASYPSYPTYPTYHLLASPPLLWRHETVIKM